MIAGGARPPRDVEGLAQQRLVIRANGGGGHDEGSMGGRERLA